MASRNAVSVIAAILLILMIPFSCAINNKTAVNGFQAEKVGARPISGQDTLRTMSYFIAKAGAVHAFHGMTIRQLSAQSSPASRLWRSDRARRH
jgi:hypothetical protein